MKGFLTRRQIGVKSDRKNKEMAASTTDTINNHCNAASRLVYAFKRGGVCYSFFFQLLPSRRDNTTAEGSHRLPPSLPPPPSTATSLPCKKRQICKQVFCCRFLCSSFVLIVVAPWARKGVRALLFIPSHLHLTSDLTHLLVELVLCGG